ncbi:MAG: hypothetical protein WDW38_009182 [Sanguina aurantia]
MSSARSRATDAVELAAAPAPQQARSAAASGMSPISSRNSVPPSACSKRPETRLTAPVKAPASWPNSSLSSSSRSGRGARAERGKGFAARQCTAVHGDKRTTSYRRIAVRVAASPLIAGSNAAGQPHQIGAHRRHAPGAAARAWRAGLDRTQTSRRCRASRPPPPRAADVVASVARARHARSRVDSDSSSRFSTVAISLLSSARARSSSAIGEPPRQLSRRSFEDRGTQAVASVLITGAAARSAARARRAHARRPLRRTWCQR